MLRYLVPALILVGAPASAEVVRSAAGGFEVSSSAIVAASPERAWPVVVAPRLWWDKDHTYSDDSANLTLDERPGGCFCEKLPNKGGVEHMRVVYIQPPQMIRMTGGLGPLQAEGATGTLAITLAKEGEGTKVTISYVAGGYFRSGAERMAPLVDRVLSQQLAGLKAAIEGGAPAATPARAAVRPTAKPVAAKPAGPEPLSDVGNTISNLGAEGEPAPDLRTVPPRSDTSDTPR